MKIIDILNKKLKESNDPFFSFEYFPPKTEKGVENLYERLDRMSLLEPQWIDVTWGAGGSTSKLTLEICHAAQKYVGVETMMHMTCTNMPVEAIRASLEKAKEFGIQNILALRGDPPRGEVWKQIEGGFAHAADLVRFIRREFGDYFGICVAGYPEGHVDAVSYEDDLKHLKEKVDAGADLVITQLFYDVDRYGQYVADCRALGVTVPILPGIMPIHGYAGFERMTTLCKTAVPAHVRAALEPIKNDDEAVRAYGVKLGMDMCRELVTKHGVRALHFYTLNLEKSVVQILQGLELVDEIHRPLPWKSVPTTNSRAREDVRPIFWANRPKSYMSRTESWDEFPNGRWGDSRSPAFGELTDFHLGMLHVVKDSRPEHYGAAPTKPEEVFNVFARYCRAEVPMLPWCDTPLSLESDLIKAQLVRLNTAGFLTINSQPAVNGAHSTDPKVGWGPKGGFVYQKAYLEFFTSEGNLKRLLDAVKNFPSITYCAVNVKGDTHGNTPAHSTNAVTWGVFPCKEIVQPTVADYDSFAVWKDEAFALWESNWGMIYPEGSSSRALIQSIMGSYFLVNMVDNNFVDGDIWRVFDFLDAPQAGTSS